MKSACGHDRCWFVGAAMVEGDGAFEHVGIVRGFVGSGFRPRHAEDIAKLREKERVVRAFSG
jgi:hypothetical protein